MSEHMETVSEWVESFREDVETLKRVVDCEKVDEDARRFAAAALNYLVSRMDLIPDWTPTIGVIDDVLILRLCIELASTYGLSENLDADTLIDVGRLTNEAERVIDIIGGDLFAKLRKHAARLVDDPVRGRTPQSILDDKKDREQLYADVEEELLRMPAATFEDAEDVDVKLKSYLTAKLKSV